MNYYFDAFNTKIQPIDESMLNDLMMVIIDLLKMFSSTFLTSSGVMCSIWIAMQIPRAML